MNVEGIDLLDNCKVGCGRKKAQQTYELDSNAPTVQQDWQMVTFSLAERA